MWDIQASSEFEDWLFKLDGKGQAAVAKSVDKLSFFGPVLGRPDVDSIKGSRHSNMKELRVKHAGHQYRILFAFDPRREGLLLIGGDKVGENENRFYKKLIGQADRIYDQHLEQLP